ncbi:hypothetical protein HF888_11610 [Bermanella marisrubri]|uniref:ATPase n=1 Tax=Bermanella marisrubri TaxID=207949 RepID=Q1N2P8_9GAMM|nr:hypothetical protein [Bermanella marisrubri]EAT12621.1 hypothetical protein RED65_06988 [Oceanobacter sp. RED65] [Bermanella marisrubri]QIZ84828.1 hypothetical protein HF888_11610 [Bermanella marisrubri]
MHYKTVKDVIDYSRKLHHQMSEFYHNLGLKQEQIRVGMLLEYLKRHELHLEHVLDQFERDKSQKVLDSWFSYAPEQNLTEALADIEIHQNMSADEVVIMALQLDDYFISLYEGMVESANSPTVKSVFQNLLEMEQQEKIRTARTALELRDM